jgi:xanthine/CO dehydrogenase XdhC/CoxF family maturation factor
MNHSGVSLGDFFRAGRDRGEPLVLATVARTLGSTYRKAGAQMLIAGDGRAAGLLSGGCLEADLMERARAVLAGTPDGRRLRHSQLGRRDLGHRARLRRRDDDPADEARS